VFVLSLKRPFTLYWL